MTAAKSGALALARGLAAQAKYYRDPLQAAMRACVTTDAAMRQITSDAEAIDLVELMKAVARMILAVDQLESAARNMMEGLRDHLAFAMADSGAGEIKTEFHAITVSEKPGSVDVLEPDKLPAQFWFTPERRPDKKKIAAAIRAKENVPGATLSGNGVPTIRFRSLK